MATIGTFKRDADNGFTGAITTLPRGDQDGSAAAIRMRLATAAAP